MPASIAASTRTPVGLQCRLGLLLFGEFAVWGLWFVSLGCWIGITRRFSGPQVGMVYGTFALNGLVTPTITGVIADQLARSERVLAALHAAGGVMSLIASRQESFGALYAAILLYASCYLPTILLATSLSMRHLRAAASEYPRVRTLGTLGWIVAGLTIGALGLELSPRPMQMAGITSLLLGAAAWAVRCLLLAIGSNRSLVAIYAGILMHGVVYGCIYVAGQLMVHDRAPSQMQFAAQGFMALATMGIGNLGAAWIAGGAVATYTSSAARHDWRAIWLVAAAVSSVATIGILLCWRISESAPCSRA